MHNDFGDYPFAKLKDTEQFVNPMNSNFILTNTEFLNDSIVNGFELLATQPGQILISVNKLFWFSI